MPIYDYRCDHCGHAFSAVRSFSDEPMEKCPSCGKRPRKLLVAPAVVFKGSGWYVTDSRGKAPKESDSSSSGSSGDRKAEATTAKASSIEGKGTKPAPDTKSSGTGEGAS